VALPVRVTPARLLTSSTPALPPGAKTPARPVRLQAQIDLDGTFQRASYIGGPPELVEAAMQAIKGWTVEPAKVNGAPISTPVTLMVTFAPAEPGRH
jgi:TonB family protein